MRRMTPILLILILLIAALPAGFSAGQLTTYAQGPDAWTTIDLNMRAAPNHDTVIAILPPNTGLIFEARDAGMNWLLGHTEDGLYRGWVVTTYLTYATGFSAARLPVSEEVVTAGSPPPAADQGQAAASDSGASDVPAMPPSTGTKANGTIESMTLIYESARSEYYHLTYWSDGLRINGYIGFPKGGGPYPAMIYNRGGWGDSGMLTGIEIVPFVETGFVAAGSQYRGNAGSEGISSFGHGDVIDVLNLLVLLQQHPKVDASRVGMMGGSRGGMVTYMALKHETESGYNRIRVAVTVGGLADLPMWYYDSPDFQNVLQIMVGPSPEAAPEQYQVRSATYWPGSIGVPLLLLHGGNDWIISPEQSRKLYEGMKAAGRDVSLMVFEGDNHELTGQLGGYRDAIQWMGTYMRNGTTYQDQWDNIRAATQAIAAR
ncbi:MAG: prolyl oligopeptidase family serine peptidase [Anaerolineae bacterium]|nr:prolyl oligopeptidase family serine peptidase [Anaerolineae bacterium]